MNDLREDPSLSLLTYKEAAARLTLEGLRMSVSKLKALKAAGKLRVIKTGHCTVRIRAVELEKFKQRSEVGGVA